MLLLLTRRWRRLLAFTRGLRGDALVVYLAMRDPRTPPAARIVALLVVAYAFSPIDIVPDFVPVLGQLDDLLLVPVGLWLAMRLIPGPVLADCRTRALELESARKPRFWLGTVIVILVWAALAVGAWLLWRGLQR
jgi:uncharacterized membrane protein YkvA (DUF1232 family)